MGFGTSMTQAIFFIASALVALAIVGIFTVATTNLANSFSMKSKELSDQIKTGVKISGDSCYFGSSTYVYVKNTGASFLEANSANIFVDGAVYATNNIDIYKNNAWTPYSDLKIWEPGQLARFNTTSALPTGYHRLRVVTQNGVYDSVEYSDC